MTEEEELEYRILFYLNSNIEIYDITDAVLRGQFFSAPEKRYQKAIASLGQQNYVGNKINQGKGITITPDGQKRLNEIQSKINLENNKRTKNILTLTSLIGILGLIGLGIQCYFIYQQNKIIQLQNLEQAKQWKIENESHSKETIRVIHDTVL